MSNVLKGELPMSTKWIKKRVCYTCFAVKDMNAWNNWDGSMMFGAECYTVKELNAIMREHGIPSCGYIRIYSCALDINSSTTYFGYGFTKKEAFNDLMKRI